MTIQSPTQGPDLRQLAVSQLRKRRGLHGHLIAYVTVNLFLTAIWLTVSPGGFFWPVFPIFGWGIGLVFNIWDVYWPNIPTEDMIDREMRRLERGHPQ